MTPEEALDILVSIAKQADVILGEIPDEIAEAEEVIRKALSMEPEGMG